MSTSTVPARALLLVALLATHAAAQGHPDHATPRAELGSVHFPTSCRPEVAPSFDRVVFGNSVATARGLAQSPTQIWT